MSSLLSSFSSQLFFDVRLASEAKKVDLKSGFASEKDGSPNGCTIPDNAGMTSPSSLDFDINLHSSATMEFTVSELADPVTAIEMSCQMVPLANQMQLSQVFGLMIGLGTHRGGLPQPKCTDSRMPKKRSIAAMVPGTVRV